MLGKVKYFERQASGTLLELTGEQNPFADVDLSGHAVPAIADWDGDGLLDLLAGEGGGNIFYFHQEAGLNLSAAPVRHMRERTESGSEFDGFDVGSYSSSEAADWDGDGDLDLIVGEEDGIQYYERQANKSLVLQTGSRNPFRGILRHGHARPKVVDWDGDGHLDLIVGDASGGVFYYQRELNQSLTLKTGSDNPFRGINATDPEHSFNSTPCSRPEAVDWDGDGDLDLILAGDLIAIRYFERLDNNTLVELTGSNNPFQGIDISGSDPVAVDWDGDGDLDLLLGDKSGQIFYYNRQADHSLLLKSGSESPFDGLLLNSRSTTLEVADWDGDGDLDLLTGDKSGAISLFERQAVPQLSIRTGVENPFDDTAMDVMSSSPEVVDWDGDGYKDLLLGSEAGAIHFYQGQASGELLLKIGQDSPFRNISFAFSSPKAVDWDGDGDLDLILGGFDGTLQYYEHLDNQSLALKEGLENPFYDLDVGSFSSPEVVDWDKDGDLDVFLGGSYGRVSYYERQENRSLMLKDVYSSSFSRIPYSRVRPSVVEWDGDGDLDLLVGETDGTFSYYERQPHNNLTLLRGDKSPFNRMVVGTWASPKVVDWDDHSGLDLVIGTASEGLAFVTTSCTASYICHVRHGFCSTSSAMCSCLLGHSLADCSGCGSGSARRGTLTSTGSCMSCPGLTDDGSTCNGRGQCMDDEIAKTMALEEGASATSVMIARGNASCRCNEHFTGKDCSLGECPAGTEQLADRESRTFACQQCPPGRAKPDAGVHPCRDCSHGLIADRQGMAACVTCPTGLYQPLSGKFFCDSCLEGSVPAASGDTCDSCPAGKFASLGFAACKECEVGRVAGTGQSKCTACPKGKVARRGSSVCDLCDADQVSNSDQSACILCPGARSTFPLFRPSHTQEECLLDYAYISCPVFIFFACVMIACLIPLMFLPAHIEDIRSSDHLSSKKGGGLIITTFLAHHIFSHSVRQVCFKKTSVNWLDSPGPGNEVFLVKVLSPHCLLLCDSEGQPYKSRSGGTEASRGFIRLIRPKSICAASFIGVPVAAWISGLLIIVVVVIALDQIDVLAVLGLFAISLPASAVFHYLRWQYASRNLPFRRQLRKYSDWIKKENPKPKPCKPGPNRAVTIGQLQDFYHHFRQFISSRDMYYVCPNLVLPLTKRSKLSFAELVGDGAVEYFVSHFWGTGFENFIRSLRKHSKCKHGKEDLNWRDSRYWICTFSNNQWKLDEEIPKNGSMKDSSFYQALHSSSCKATCMILDEKAMPLTRSWCLYEIIQTLGIDAKNKNNFEGLTFLTSSGVLNYGMCSVDLALKIGEKLSCVSVKDAQASVAADKVSIDLEVHTNHGGFDKVDQELRRRMLKVFHSVENNFAVELSNLRSKLNYGATPTHRQEEPGGDPVVKEHEELVFFPREGREDVAEEEVLRCDTAASSKVGAFLARNQIVSL